MKTLTDAELRMMSWNDFLNWASANIPSPYFKKFNDWRKVYYPLKNRWSRAHGIVFVPSTGHRSGKWHCRARDGSEINDELSGANGYVRLFKTSAAAQKACDKFSS